MLGGLRLLGWAASALYRPCEYALSALRVRTLGPVSTHSRPCEYALTGANVYT